MSQASDQSQTASDYITAQLKLEADAREALPYQFDTCTKPLGPLRQSGFACLTCTPPPASKYQQFTPAGVCYSCSISCHGEHNLVELFTKRNFVCDCGTTRLNNSGTACSLRLNSETGRKGGVAGEEAFKGNSYDQNYQGRFCGCEEEYDPDKEKGTMFQCLGLGTVEEGGCGEDWWHPECLMGLPRQQPTLAKPKSEQNGTLDAVKEEDEDTQDVAPRHDMAEGAHVEGELPLPDGFPNEDDFDHLICYKCVSANPWIKQYSGTNGFLPAVPKTSSPQTIIAHSSGTNGNTDAVDTESKKRRAEDELVSEENKKSKSDDLEADSGPPATQLNGETALHQSLPPAPEGTISLFLKDDFRDHLCRCPACFPRLAKHPQLLEEEESYEPPVSESDAPSEHNSIAGRSVNSGSLLERGEAALSNMDRVRAIEGVMAYNHVKDKVKSFLQPFAESGKVVGAEDIKAYFAQLRGDEQALRDGVATTTENRGGQDNRREQGGY